MAMDAAAVDRQRKKEQQEQEQQQQQEQPQPAVALDAWSASLLQLHEEVLAFHRWAAPRPAEVAARTGLLRRLRDLVQCQWPSARLRVFGSFRTGLYLPTSDLDLVLLGRWRSPPLRQLELALGQLADSVTVLDKATVPIVKLTDAETGISVDISCSQHNGVQAADLISQFAAAYPCLPPLLLVLKQLLLHSGLNCVWTGGVSSYALTLMVVSFLQQRPGERHLGRLLLQFLELYGQRFDYATTGIRVANGAGHLPKAQLRLRYPSMLAIEDPLLPGNDVGRSSYGVLRVRQQLQLAHCELTEALAAGSCPALTAIIGWPRRQPPPRCRCEQFGSDDSDQSDARPSSQ